jgi:hypothetical protein
MTDADPFRTLPSAGEWSRNDAGESGIKCPACGSDSGYVHRCVECGRLDPEDDPDEVALAEPGSKPHRMLASCLRSPDSLACLRAWVRGIRRVDTADAWLTAADHLSQAIPDGTLKLLVERRVAVDDNLDDNALDSVDGVRRVLAVETDRDAPRRAVVGWLNERQQRLRDNRQSSEESAPRPGLATDGGDRDATEVT